MKIALWVSGILGVLLLSLLLTGWADADDAAKKALRQGNLHYGDAEYAQALAAYEQGLKANPDNKPLVFNAAQAAYMLGDYEKAVLYYEQSEDSVEKFLSGGNIFFKVGDAVEDEEAKVQCYLQALVIYGEGIKKFPQDIPLKYNFERVREKLEIFQEDMEQEGEGEGEEGEGQEGEEGEEQGESQRGDEDGEESEGQSAQEGEDDEQEQDEASQSESGEGEEQEAESAESTEDGEEENAAQGDESDQDQQDDQQSASNRDDTQYEQDMQAIERILEVLESQEEQDLKNNQKVVRGKEGKNGW